MISALESAGRTNWIRVSEAVARMPVPISSETIRRWTRIGIGGRTLPSLRCGGVLYVSESEVERLAGCELMPAETRQ
jgi:hypothetical protein